ncbi:non-ribosomal peptide synthetase [Streptomyces sp. WAC05292]|uniref:amino acid adenylation domain-containing protein n=1 Tax=Streptomyces sp. WAC05292 TaxID=2487418 RepID=UPI000F74620B|nr:non-ribosomal peptide synthetase [Streptomyces sp. WAC05292]RSS95307.1 non-ribosomal peptide synthetase [Streptomyces sp. WAC05292]
MNTGLPGAAEEGLAEEIYEFRASRAQHRMYFLQQLAGDAPTYHMPLFHRLRGAVDGGALREAARVLVERHEALRTRFAVQDGELLQLVAREAAFEWAETDVAAAAARFGRAPQDTDGVVREWVRAEEARPFDLARGPLFRVALLRVAAEESVLLVGMHHIVSDGWSCEILFRELAEVYEALVSGAGAALPEVEFQYADYSCWQEEWLDSPAAARQRAYWEQRLAGDLPVMRLPVTRPRGAAAAERRGASLAFPLPAAAERLRELCGGADATFFHGLLAVFDLLLNRYTGLDDILVGTPIANRQRAEFASAVGLFVNTTVLRTDLSGDPTFRELLLRVRDGVLEAQEHQDMPFEELVRMKNPDRDAESSPVFQVMFGMNEVGDQVLRFAGIEGEPLVTDSGTAKFDLSLDVADTADGATGVFEYRGDLFEASVVDGLARHYARLVEAVVAEPDVPVSALRMLSEEECAVLAPAPAASAAPAPASGLRPVHELFAEWAARTPDAVALVDGGLRLGYGDLDRRANRLAHRLRGLGVGPGVMVGLSMERCADLVVALLAVLKAGGAYVPLDPAYPVDRLRLMVEDSGLRTIVTGGAVPRWWADPAGEGAAFDETVVDVTADRELLEAYPDTPVAAGAGPDDLAYVIYTSGSTGRPKGVLIPHRNISRLFTSTDHWFGFGPGDVWTLFHSYAFDFSVWELWGALAYGGRLVVVPYETSREPAAFLRLLREQRVTVLNQTPSAFHQLMRADEAAGGDPSELALRYVVFGGEALEPASLRGWFERHGDACPQLVNMYGITETTVHVTHRPITLKDLEAGSGSVIGEPIPDLHLYVLDPQGRPVPAGVLGELYVGGAGLADGYLNRPELTAERFVRHPFSADPGERLYRTGDLARRLPDGDLEYCGRTDAQIQLRGFRIELGEIEAALVGHELVHESVVLVHTDAEGHARLAAYVTPRTGADPRALDGEELRAHAGRRLPVHMVPASFTVLPEFPLTANGKVDRKRLPAPQAARTGSGRAYAAPSTPAEEALAQVWARVLDVERVGVDDNYFALGGDSIRSIRLLALAGEAGLRIGFQDLMAHQTIRALAAATAAGGADGTGGAAAPAAHPPFSLLDPADRAQLPDGLDDAYPMTRLQQGMLFHGDLAGAGGEYHNVSTYRIKAGYSEDAWREAVAGLLARHEILRTSFDVSGFREPLQLVHADVAPPVAFEDLSGLTPDAADAAAERRWELENAGRFDWRTAPLIRFHVQRRPDDTVQLYITEHHAILDGWSERSLYAELLLRYGRALSGAQAPSAAPLRSRFSSYVALERAAVEDEDSRRFWAGQLEGATLTRLPRGAVAAGRPQDEAAAVMEFTERALPDAVLEGLTALARELGVPLRTVLLAAHLRVMGLLTGTDDPVTGAVYNGRGEEADGDLALGVFLNTLPVRGRLAGGSWSDLVRGTAALDLEILRHRRYPLAEIIRCTGVSEPFESFFNYTHFHVERQLDGQSEVEVLDARGVAHTNFPFGAEFYRDAVHGGLGLGLRWDAARFDAAQIELFHGHYAAALTAMATDPEGRYETADLLSAQEHRLFAEWNGTARHYDRTHVLHALVEEQARRTPDAPAVRFGGRSLTYRELDERAERLAGLLRARGARPGGFVAVLLERSPELPVCLLAVLKSGAAYVPLDPDHPEQRLRGILADAGIPLVLTLPRWEAKVSGPGTVVVHPDAAEAGAAFAEAGAGGEASGAAGPGDAAYMIFTSGSTGTPKGVVVSHRAIVNRLLWVQDEYGLRPGEPVLQKTPATFDVSVWEFFWPLLTGAVMVLAAPGGHRDPAYLAELIGAERITTVHFVPSMLQAFVEEPSAAACTSLTRVVCSGEALPHDLQQRFLSRFTAELHNLYGPTEAAVDVTYWRCADDGSGVVPIGRPVANTGLYVLDRHGMPVPRGVTGELYLGGVQLAEGYHRRPDLTDRAFVRHTDRAGVVRRLYRTGDLVRHLPDGALEYRGRTDAQIKLRGFRIELGEIEAVLSGHPDVAECAVLLRGDRLAAYVVMRAGAAGTADPAVLSAYAADALPAYMVPSSWTEMAVMPLTGSGKLDRKALPAPAEGALARSAAAVGPRDGREARLLELWSDLLGADGLGVEDDFFAAGGHSLLALRLVSRINAAFGLRLGVSAVLAHPTVARQAELVRGGGEAARPGAAVPLRAAGTRNPLFLVHPAGGSVLCYRELAAALGADQPVYGLAAAGLDAGATPAQTVEEMAEAYLRAVREVRPAGPYRLAGWSFGGLVAHEMAVRLAAAGERVELLALVDSGHPDGSRVPGTEAEVLLHFLEDLLASSGGAEVPPETAAALASAVAGGGAGEGLRLIREELRRADPGGAPQPDDLARHHAVFRANLRAAAAYRPPVFPGAVRLYRSTDGIRAGFTEAWGRTAGSGLTVRDLDTDHYGIVRGAHAQEIARDMYDNTQEGPRP